MTNQVLELLNEPSHGLIAEEVNGEMRVLALKLSQSLGYTRVDRMLTGLREDEQGLMDVDTRGGRQRMFYVTLPGLFRAVGQRSSARVPNPAVRAAVDKFQDWLYREVVPALMQDGYYATVEYREDIANRTLMLRGLLAGAEQADGSLVLTAGQLALLRSEVADSMAAMAGLEALAAVR